MEKKPVLRSLVSTGTYEDFMREIAFLVKSKIPSYVCFANVHMVVEAFCDSDFQRVVNEADIVAPDGGPISVYLRLFEGLRQQRVCGMDVMPDILRRAEQLGASIFFYGSTDDVLQRVVRRTSVDFPSLVIAGAYSPPFKSRLSDEENQRITNLVKASNPDMVLVALGCPKQEKWMAEHKHALNTCLLGLGQAFHVYAGIEGRLPKWMRNLSLEWVYRLCISPGRLWKRYMFTNSYFIYLAGGNLLRRLVKKISLLF
jgi:N-acetylglucosaminyldiphosphoundecaprenol N-acetyl-beta-D-mannosaminyltransferase